jgi:hypothetical protein
MEKPEAQTGGTLVSAGYEPDARQIGALRRSGVLRPNGVLHGEMISLALRACAATMDGYHHASTNLMRESCRR